MDEAAEQGKSLRRCGVRNDRERLMEGAELA